MNPKEYQRLIHDWFELSYGNYLILQRSLLQSMPDEWQKDFVRLLDEFGDIYDNLPDLPPDYLVRGKSYGGKFIRDPYSNYERGRRFVDPPK